MIQSNNFEQPPQQSFNNLQNFNNGPPALNNYGNEYMNNVKENRSKFGNYLDNALAYDQHKEKKSAFNVVYETNIYNPWGKPGGGAPKLNNNTGQLQTKIAGTLQWNLNGETEQDRITRSQNNQTKIYQNLNMYKKNALPSNMSPRNFQHPARTNTTYAYDFRENMNNQGQPGAFGSSIPQPIPSQNMPSNNTNFMQQTPGRLHNTQSSFDLAHMPNIQQEADMSRMNRSNTMAPENLRPKGYSELNRLANKLNTDNQPTTTYPNMSYWFGRTGEHKTAIGAFPNPNSSSTDFSSDPRRRKLLDQLEHRSPRDQPKIYGLDNSNLPHQQNANLAFVNDPHSNHRNNYENNPMNN